MDEYYLSALVPDSNLHQPSFPLCPRHTQMKPLTTLTILSRDPMDPETLTKVATVGFEVVGEAQIILTRDEMGVIKMETADIKADEGFLTQLDDAVKSLTFLHQKLGELHMATNHAMTDMFAIHKWLTR